MIDGHRSKPHQASALPTPTSRSTFVFRFINRPNHTRARGSPPYSRRRRTSATVTGNGLLPEFVKLMTWFRPRCKPMTDKRPLHTLLQRPFNPSESPSSHEGKRPAKSSHLPARARPVPTRPGAQRVGAWATAEATGIKGLSPGRSNSSSMGWRTFLYELVSVCVCAAPVGERRLVG